MTNNQSNSGAPSSFSLGLALGVLTGAGAFYIFGTKKGQKIKHQFIKEFEKAKEELEQNPKFAEANEQIHKAITKWEKNEDNQEVITQAKSIWQLVTDKVEKLTAKETPTKKEPTKVYFKRK